MHSLSSIIKSSVRDLSKRVCRCYCDRCGENNGGEEPEPELLPPDFRTWGSLEIRDVPGAPNEVSIYFLNEYLIKWAGGVPGDYDAANSEIVASREGKTIEDIQYSFIDNTVTEGMNVSTNFDTIGSGFQLAASNSPAVISPFDDYVVRIWYTGEPLIYNEVTFRFV